MPGQGQRRAQSQGHRTTVLRTDTCEVCAGVGGGGAAVSERKCSQEEEEEVRPHRACRKNKGKAFQEMPVPQQAEPSRTLAATRHRAS